MQCWYEDGEIHFEVSMNGLMRLLHRQPQFCGIAFNESLDLDNGVPHWIECTIIRAGQYPAYVAREYFKEVKQDSTLWEPMPRRMPKQRVAQQAVRYASGIEFHQSFSRLGQLPQRDSSKSHFNYPQSGNLASGRTQTLKEVQMHQNTGKVGAIPCEIGATNTAHP